MRYQNLPQTKKKLGISYRKDRTTFRVWSPLRDRIDLLLYEDGSSSKRKTFEMIKDEEGVHEARIDGDLKGKFYTFLVEDIMEVTDPYSVSSSKNSIRSAIIDLEDTNPEGWKDYHSPETKEAFSPIIYEAHVKDFTAHWTSGVEKRGKYLGFVEEEPLNHLKELGVTHIHLMPVFDFLTVREEDELFLKDNNYNWGYDPELYNVPEGSYATNPEDPLVRIRELKTLIMELQKSGFKVIMDVVYNHTYRSYDSNFNILMPGYYYRQYEDGSFSNGSGTGNELATERPMVRQFIVDSLKYWVEEYRIDGFRFDLMALIDIQTVDRILYELRLIKPDIFIYGEPWAADRSLLADRDQTRKTSQEGRGFAFFNDDFRNAIKGDNDGYGRGFIQGRWKEKREVETGLAGSIYYDNSRIGFTRKSKESINYINSHDNLIIRDKIKKSFPRLDMKGQERLNKLGFSILFTAQGIPFFHSGNEFMRTKEMEANSYNLPLSINALDWDLKYEHEEYFNYFKDLISFRKSYEEFNLVEEEEIRKRLKFMDLEEEACIISYTISRKDQKSCLLLIHNASHSSYILAKEKILDHVNKTCKPGKEIESIISIFDLQGIVKEKKDISYYHGIEIPHLSTMVYEIRLK